MEDLFFSTTRLQSFMRVIGYGFPNESHEFPESECSTSLWEAFKERSITVDSVPPFTLAALFDFLRPRLGRVLWLTSRVMICRSNSPHSEDLLEGHENTTYDCVLSVRDGDGPYLELWVDAPSTEVKAACRFLLYLLGRSRPVEARLVCRGNPEIAGEDLSNLFAQMRGTLCRFTLNNFCLTRDHCRALSTFDNDYGAEMQVELRSCHVLEEAEATFIACLQKNRGPTDLMHCSIPSRVLVQGLRGNYRVKKIVIWGMHNNANDDGDADDDTNEAEIADLLTQVRINPRVLHLDCFALTRAHWRALATVSEEDVEIKLSACFVRTDAEAAFVACLQADRGPTELDSCSIDSRVLGQALCGNTRLKKLYFDLLATDKSDGLECAKGLAKNLGLEELRFNPDVPVKDESLRIWCKAFQKHPMLERLDLHTSYNPENDEVYTPERTARRMIYIADMLKTNKKLQSIRLSQNEIDSKVHEKSILPQLKINSYRSRFAAVLKAPDMLADKLLGRALARVGNDINLVHALVRESTGVICATEQKILNVGHVEARKRKAASISGEG